MNPTAILIVEDEFILANDLALRLQDLGYAVVGVAATGADAVALADRQHPNLILMDIHLQGPLDGVDAALEIRRRQRLPVVFLTAYADDDTLQRAKLAEPFGYILKPFEDRELRTLIEIALYKHRAEEEIRRLNGLYATLSQINQAIIRIGVRQELLDEVCRITVRYAGFQLAWVGWIDPQTQQVRPIAQAGSDLGYLADINVYADDRPEGRGPVGVCLREGRSCVINDFLHDPRTAPWRAAARRYGLHAAAAMPIRFQGAACAAFVVYAATSDIFQAQEIDLLEEAAGDLSFALDHLETERQRQHADEKLQASEARLRENSEFLHTLLEAIPTPIFYKDTACRYLGCNQAFSAFYGKTQQELIGKQTFDVAPRELAELYHAKDLELLQHPTLQVYDCQMQDASGGLHDVVFHKATFTGADGQVGGIVGAILDITERKRMEEALRYSKARLTSLFRAAPVGIGLVRDRVILEVNDFLCRMTGYAQEDLCGKSTRLLYLSNQDHDWVGQEKYRQIAERGIGTVEVRWRRKDGEIIWVILSSTPLDVRDLSKGVTFSALDITDRKQAEARIEHLTYHDELTQLPNRVLLTDRLHQAMAQSQRDQKRLAVCYLDLDDFKPLNDLWGRDQGDQILVEVAQRLKRSVRAGDTVARLGGDEFVLLLGDLTDLEECEHALDRVFTALQAPFPVAGQSPSLTASLGVTLYPDDESDPDTLLRHVDQAMYAAKQAGGHCYRWFDADHDRRARIHRDLLQRVEAGLAAGEFCLYYQPKVDMRTGAVIGAEALIRWRRPEHGLISPAQFMPAVEASQLAITVDRWVMREALRQMTAWAARGLSLPVSVNVSGRHLQQPDFVAGLQAALEAYPATPPGWLELEILETAALDDVAAISRLIEACRQLGVRFALDDFGTGYSSLTYLKHLPVQVLKIDQSFVRDLLVDADARAIVEGVIGLSTAFRREVIAEGVETDDHGCRLMQLGCDLAQGYGIARPMPPDRIPAWIAGWALPRSWADEAEPEWTGPAGIH